MLAAGLLALLLLLRTPATAAPSTYLNFQGRLKTDTGALVADGYYNIEFKIYDHATAGSLLWTETRTGGNQVRVANGYFSVSLGSVSPFPGTIDWSQQLWITMNVGGTGSPTWDGEMTNGGTRMILTAVPYAFQADTSNTTRGVITAASEAGGSNGGMYYNSTIGKFRCFEGGAWKDCIGSAGAGDILNGGNSFGTELTIGTNDLNVVNLEVHNVTKLTLGTAALGLSVNTLQFDNSGGDKLIATSDHGSDNSRNLGIVTGTSSASGTTSGNLTILTGSGTGTGTDSGNIYIDVGSATGTAGTISLGAANTSALLLGRTGLTTQVQGGLNVAQNLTVGTSDATGTLLVLDTKTNAGDPTGVDGAMYYNADAGKFRCYEAGSWSDCITAVGAGDILNGGNSFGDTMTIGTNDTEDLVLETSGQERLTITGAGTATLNANTLIAGQGGGEWALQVVDAGSTHGGISVVGNGGTMLAAGVSGGSWDNFAVFGDGRASFRSAWNSTAAFSVNDEDDNTILGVDTVDGSVSASYLSAYYGMQSSSLTLAGHVPTSFTSPMGYTYDTRINIPLYDPGTYNNVLSLGVPDGAATSSKAIGLFDDRAAGNNQPVLGIYSPDEQAIFGLGTDGSNSYGYLKGVGMGVGIKVDTSVVATFNSGTAAFNGTVGYTAGTANTNTAVCRNSSGQLAGCTSSQRYKTDVQAAVVGLEELRLLQPVTYTWTTNGQADLGFIAEEVAAVIPQAVTYDENGEVASFNPNTITALLTSAVKQLDLQVRALEGRIAALEARAVGDLPQLHVTGTATFDGTVIFNGKLVTAGATPTIAAAGGSADIGGTDTAGWLSFTVAGEPTTGEQVVVTFDTPRDGQPTVSVTAHSEAAGSVRYYARADAHTFSLYFIDPPQPGAEYRFNYLVVEARGEDGQ